MDPIYGATTVPLVRGTAAGMQNSPDIQQLLAALAMLQQGNSGSGRGGGGRMSSPVMPGPVGGVDPVMSLIAMLQQQYGPEAIGQLLQTLGNMNREDVDIVRQMRQWDRQGSDVGRMTDTGYASAMARGNPQGKVDALARQTAADRHVKARSAGVDPFAPSFSQEVGHQRAGEDDAQYRQRMVDYKKAQADKAARERAASGERKADLAMNRSPWSIEINGQKVGGGTWGLGANDKPAPLNAAGQPLANAQRAQEEEEMRKRILAAMQW